MLKVPGLPCSFALKAPGLPFSLALKTLDLPAIPGHQTLKGAGPVLLARFSWPSLPSAASAMTPTITRS
jgi:hypothetical protein